MRNDFEFACRLVSCVASPAHLSRKIEKKNMETARSLLMLSLVVLLLFSSRCLAAVAAISSGVVAVDILFEFPALPLF